MCEGISFFTRLVQCNVRRDGAGDGDADWLGSVRPDGGSGLVRVPGEKAVNWSSGGMAWADECRRHVDRVEPVLHAAAVQHNARARARTHTPSQAGKHEGHDRYGRRCGRHSPSYVTEGAIPAVTIV